MYSDCIRKAKGSEEVGFCIFLGKPIVVLENKLNLKTSKYWQKRINQIFKSKAYTDILNEFIKQNYKITPKQRQLIDKYWGTSNIKSKKELKKIVAQTQNLYQNLNS